MAPPMDPIHLQRHVGDIIGFRATDQLVMIVTGGVPVNAQASGDLERALNCTETTTVAPSACRQFGRQTSKTSDDKKAE